MKKNAQVWQVVGFALLALGALAVALSDMRQSAETREILNIIAELTGIRICPEEQCPDVPGAQAVRERIGIDSRVDSYLYWAADLIFYSDDHDTQVFAIDGATGDISAQGDLTIDDILNVDAVLYTSSGTQTLDPVATHYVLSPSAQLTLTIATTSAVNSNVLWILINSAQTVTIVDTGATAGGGNRVLGQYDWIEFLYYDLWIETGTSDNS